MARGSCQLCMHIYGNYSTNSAIQRSRANCWCPKLPRSDRKHSASILTLRLSQKSFDNSPPASHIHDSFCVAMLGSRLFPNAISSCSPTILQFPAEPLRAIHTLRIMTTQLLQEASQIIPNPQLLINVISKRVRQLGLAHRPMVEAGPRASLTDIALKEIIAGKLTYEEQSASTDGA